jgi:hypothetical protein
VIYFLSVQVVYLNPWIVAQMRCGPTDLYYIHRPAFRECGRCCRVGTSVPCSGPVTPPYGAIIEYVRREVLYYFSIYVGILGTSAIGGG